MIRINRRRPSGHEAPVTGMILEDTIGVSGGVVKELGEGLGSGVGGFGRRKGAERNEHGAVDGACVV